MTFKPGHYEAEIDRPAKIKAEVTVEDEKIVDVKFHTLKDEQPLESDLAAEFRGQILNAQSVNIDGISTASILTKSIKSVVGKALADARI